MITLDTNNGHDKKIIDAFNDVSKKFNDYDLLSHILVNWADDSNLECMTSSLNDLIDENDDTRVCDITGEPMTEGWVANDGEMYFKYEKDALAWCIENGYESIEDAYENEAIYWTEWEV